MSVRVALFPMISPSKPFVSGAASFTFTLSSKTTNGGYRQAIGCGGNVPINGIFPDAVAVLSSGTSNGCF